MSIPMDTYCLECQFNRNMKLARSLGSDEKATEFMYRWMQIVLNQPPKAPSPCAGPATNELLHEMYGLDLDRYAEEKRMSNAFAMSQMEEVRRRCRAAEDPVYAGLQFAILGNYLDFAALQDKISFGELSSMLDKAQEIQVDAEVYGKLCRDLATGKNLVYLTDNAGEIGFDRVFAEQLREAYPNLTITFCVRGGIAANDATREDAQAVGLDFPLIDNGNQVAGTVLELLSQEATQVLSNADVILSKGMGNAETLLNCGKNVYYAFLVKCQRFSKLTGKPLMTPMLLRELDER